MRYFRRQATSISKLQFTQLSTCRVCGFHRSGLPWRSESMVMHSAMFAACPASTGAFGSLRLRMHSRKLRIWLGAAGVELPRFFLSPPGFFSHAAGGFLDKSHHLLT